MNIYESTESLETTFSKLVEDKNWRELKTLLNGIAAVDVAELLEGLDTEVAVAIFRLMVKSKSGDVFAYLSPKKSQEFLEIFSHQQLSDVMDNLEPDERVNIMEELPGRLTRKVLWSMKPEDQAHVIELLGYPDESIGRLMNTRLVRVKSHWTVKKGLAHIRVFGKDAETLNVIYVVDEAGKLIDDLRLTQIVMADPKMKISDLMDGYFQALKVTDDQEEAVRMLSKYDRVALPVVDTEGMLVGLVTADDVFDIAEEEVNEDMQLMAGMNALNKYYSESGIFELVKKRMGWLLVLFLGQMLTVTALASFEETLAAAAILAFFIPMIISSGGNSGSQAATLIIRALSTGDVERSEWKRVFLRELLSGLLLGVMVGVLGSLVIALWLVLRGELLNVILLYQILTIGMSLVGVVIFGNLTGSMLPFILSRLGFDPAVSSAPFVSTLVDVTGIIIYFTLASYFLSGIVM